MTSTTLPQSLSDLAHQIKGALSALETRVEVEVGEKAALVMALHPQLNATVAVELQPSESGGEARLLLMLADATDLGSDPAEMTRLLGLNAHLMTSCVAVVDIAGQPVVALTANIPATDLVAAEVAPRFEEIAWEYGQVTDAIEGRPNPDAS